MGRSILKGMGLAEINEMETQEVEEGVIGVIVGGILAGAVISAMDHWPDIKQGFLDAVNGN